MGSRGGVVEGYCDPAFQPIREAVAQNIANGGIREAFTRYADGELKVDLWAGHRDAARSLP
jgi:hypothetical protein